MKSILNWKIYIVEYFKSEKKTKKKTKKKQNKKKTKQTTKVGFEHWLIWLDYTLVVSTASLTVTDKPDTC